MKTLRRLADFWAAAEETALALLVLTMVGLSATQIVLRNFFGTGLSWADPMLGTSVLWITMLGALTATGARKHININVISHFLPARLGAAAAAAADVFAAVACGLLSYASLRYVGFLREGGETTFLGVPVWAAYSAMPLFFVLMALRFALHAVLDCARAAGRAAAAARSPGTAGSEP